MSDDLLPPTAGITSAYIGNHTVAAADVPNLLRAVHAALSGLGGPPELEPDTARPAVSVRRSLTPEALICLSCGRQFQSIKRHLMNSHGMAPADYRQRWNLPADYPTVAPNYAESRSKLAKAIGLGSNRKTPTAAAPPPAPPPTAPKRTRKPKGALTPSEAFGDPVAET